MWNLKSSEVVNTAGDIFLPGGENLRSDFDDLNLWILNFNQNQS